MTAAPGQRLNLGPTEIFGWLNALPDADAVVDLNVNGTKVQFSGLGYHDKVRAEIYLASPPLLID